MLFFGEQDPEKAYPSSRRRIPKSTPEVERLYVDDLVKQAATEDRVSLNDLVAKRMVSASITLDACSSKKEVCTEIMSYIDFMYDCLAVAEQIQALPEVPDVRY